MAEPPTDSQRGCLWRIPAAEVPLSELSGTVLCKRSPTQTGGGGGGCVFWGFGEIRNSLVVYFFQISLIKASAGSDGQASLIDFTTGQIVP